MTIEAPRPLDPDAPTVALDSASVENSVKSFYNNYGWVPGADGKIGEDKAYRTFRPAYDRYTAGSQERTAKIVARGGSLLIAGCGDMPASHVAIANRFDHVTCIDISEQAIARAAKALRPEADMHLGSILDMTLPDNTFDVVFCAHVLYHINGADQERAVRQLIRVTKPGGRVVFLYFNPGSPFRVAGGLVSRLLSLAEKLRALAEKLGAKSKNQAEAAPELYFLAHRLSWWQRFSDTCRLSIQPWEVVGSRVERLLIWSDGMARMFYAASAAFETRLPALAAQAWMFPIIILDKQ